MTYKDMFTVLVVDSRIERSASLRDAFGAILGHLRGDHHLRTDVVGKYPGRGDPPAASAPLGRPG